MTARSLAMPRFFFEPDSLLTDEKGSVQVVLTGDNARHISLSLRMRVGDCITLCDGRGRDHRCVIRYIDRESVKVDVLSVIDSTTEPPYHVTLFQSLAKGEKMDFIIQKAVELGVSEIVPVESERSVVKMLDGGERTLKKVARWQKIADEASGQCGRGILPTVRLPITLSDALHVSEGSLSLFCYEGEDTSPISSIISSEHSESRISVFVGPEGGYSENEVRAAIQSGARLTGLGRRILRTETAGLFVLSALSFALER